MRIQSLFQGLKRAKALTKIPYFCPMKNLLRLFLFITSSCLCICLDAQQILIDESFDDWDSAPMTVDDYNDNISGLDIEKISISNDKDYLFIQFDLDEEILLQENNFLSLYIDIDQNENTGYKTEGIGAEISFYFGDRSGFVNFNPGFENIIHYDIGLLTAPTVSSERFEIAIKRRNSVDGNDIILDNTIDIVFENDIYDGDKIPNSNTGLAYSFNDDIVNTLPEFSFSKAAETDLRVVNYNVLRDDLFESNLNASYTRVLRAIDADVIAFQEIYNHSSAQTAQLIEQMLPSTGGQQWYHEKVGSDLVLLSRYPIIDDRWVDGNAAFVLDVNGKEVLLINVHFPCCDNDFERQNEINALLKFIRDTQDGFEYSLTENAPILIVGDYNLVGFRSQIESLLTGNITNNANYGPDFMPDWGQGSLKDLKPPLTGLPAVYTWRGEDSSFFPGRLDYIVYTGSSIFPLNSFVLNTETLGQDELSLNNLSQNDTRANSDHLPMVSDWSFEEIVYTDDVSKLAKTNIWPNPFSSHIHISSDQEILETQLFDIRGKLLKSYAAAPRIQLPQLSQLYILKIIYLNGDVSFHKIVRQ